MKITAKQLKELIKENIRKTLNENPNIEDLEGERFGDEPARLTGDKPDLDLDPDSLSEEDVDPEYDEPTSHEQSPEEKLLIKLQAADALKEKYSGKSPSEILMDLYGKGFDGNNAKTYMDLIDDLQSNKFYSR